MSDKQPEAIGYAIGLESRGYLAEAKELRRLHEVNQELLEALEQMVDVFLDTEGSYGDAENEAISQARAAIAKATGEAK